MIIYGSTSHACIALGLFSSKRLNNHHFGHKWQADLNTEQNLYLLNSLMTWTSKLCQYFYALWYFMSLFLFCDTAYTLCLHYQGLSIFMSFSSLLYVNTYVVIPISNNDLVKNTARVWGNTFVKRLEVLTQSYINHTPLQKSGTGTLFREESLTIYLYFLIVLF